jgi:hypothetical protein
VEASRWIYRAAIILAAIAGSPVSQTSAADLTVAVVAGAEPEIVFRHETDACAKSDVPDVPARALRDAEGQVRLFSSHWINREMVGPDLNRVRPTCSVSFEGGGRDDPAAHDDRGWIVSTYSFDGRTVHALIHNEYHGHKRRALYPTGRYTECWYNTITAAVSTDGGRSFKSLPPPAHFVAGVPYRFDGSRGKRSGLFNPTNIVERDGYYYVMLNAEGQGAQARGNCLMRTDRLDDPTAWRAWNGAGFHVRFSDPYGASAGEDRTSVCAPVGGLTRLMTSITRHRPTGLYVGLFNDRQRPDSKAEPVDGVYYAISPDLMTWSKPRLLYASPTTLHPGCDSKPVVYPSLLDPDSPSRNFEDAGNTAWLYVTRLNLKGCKFDWNRDLVRIPVALTATP